MEFSRKEQRSTDDMDSRRLPVISERDSLCAWRYPSSVRDASAIGHQPCWVVQPLQCGDHQRVSGGRTQATLAAFSLAQKDAAAAITSKGRGRSAPPRVSTASDPATLVPTRNALGAGPWAERIAAGGSVRSHGVELPGRTGRFRAVARSVRAHRVPENTACAVVNWKSIGLLIGFGSWPRCVGYCTFFGKISIRRQQSVWNWGTGHVRVLSAQMHRCSPATRPCNDWKFTSR